MHLLLTGATGFIGRHVLARFAARGPLTVLARREPDEALRNELGGMPVTWLVTDLSDDARITADRACLASVTHIIHLAGYSQKKWGEQIALSDVLRNNLTALVGLFERLPGTCQYFSYISTIDVYGSAMCSPVSEDEPAQPTTVYGASKLAAEAICRTVAARRSIALSVLRLSQVYGPGEAAYEKVIPVFIRRALAGEPLQVIGDGSDARDFVFIGDVVDGIELALQKQAVGTFNIAGGKPVRIAAVVEGIARLIPGTHIESISSERKPNSVYLDIRAARAAFGFNPRTELEDGLAQEIEWFKSSLRRAHE